MAEIYCIRCKFKTETDNPTTVVSPKGVEMLQGTCVACKAKKSKIVRRLKKPKESELKEEKEVVDVKPRRKKVVKDQSPVCSPVS